MTEEELSKVVVRKIGSQLAKSIAGETAAVLKEMKREFMLSGDDSPLQNSWEEYCAQIQGEESFFFDAFISTVENSITSKMATLSIYEKCAILLNSDKDTNDWRDWKASVSEVNRMNEITVDDQLVLEEVKSELDRLADRYSSDSLTAYLFGGAE